MPDAKIKSKDLSYDPTLPPFLQRLHAQKAGRGGDPDRHEHAIARPKRVKKDAVDDGPTIVDESGETIEKAELEKMNGALENGKDDVEATPVTDAQDTGIAPLERKGDGQKVTDGGVGIANKKRKVVKVVGDDDEAKGEELEQDGEEKSKPVKKSKKKSKPIKLAFDGEEEEGP